MTTFIPPWMVRVDVCVPWCLARATAQDLSCSMSDDDNIPRCSVQSLQTGSTLIPAMFPSLSPSLGRVDAGRPPLWSRSGTGRMELTQRPPGTLQVRRNHKAAIITFLGPSMSWTPLHVNIPSVVM